MIERNPKVLVLQTGGTIGQRRDHDGVFHPCALDYLPMIRGIELLPGQEDAFRVPERIIKIQEKRKDMDRGRGVRSTPKEIPQSALEVKIGVERNYVLARTYHAPQIDITAIQTENIDSTAMTHAQRIAIAELIYKHAHDYDGFVVIHGTDTMIDTGAALPLMIRNLDKPVVLTGSQRSIYERGSDADNNVLNAVEAATRDLGEVVISFGDRIVRANRALKVSEQGLNAFDSPRMEPVGDIGIDIMLRDHRIGRSDGDPILFTAFDTAVDYYSPKSGTETSAFERGYVDNPDVRGIIFGGYGAGNIPPRFDPLIKRCVEAGKPVLVTTNCLEGAADMGLYGVSSALEFGAAPAGDMTSESIAQKLMYALGRAKVDGVQKDDLAAYVHRIVKRNYANEISVVGKRF
jgi:L-asparaginase